MPSQPIGYLITALLLAWCTYFVVAPRRWWRPLRALGLYIGVVNELPFYALVWLAGATWLAFSEGDVTSIVGLVALGLTILAAAGLLVIVYWGLETAPVVHRALDVGLEAQWRTAVDRKVSDKLQTRLPPKALLGPFFVRRPDVVRMANVRYGDAGVFNLLDVYRHRSRPTHCPVLIHFHGGAFVSGRKNGQAARPLLYYLASRGWIVISANYRLSPAATYADQVVDAKRVIAWVRTHGQEYGADPAAVFVAGSSAGAMLAAMAALTPNDLALQPGFERADTSVSAAITLCGAYDWPDSIGTTSARRDQTGLHALIPARSPGEDPETWAQSSRLARIRDTAPPFFVLHGERDTILPAKAARQFAKKLRDISRCPVVYAELPGGLHNFDLFHSIRNEVVMNGIEAFAAWVLAQERP